MADVVDNTAEGSTAKENGADVGEKKDVGANATAVVPLNLDYMFYGCRMLDAPVMSFQDIAPRVGSMDYAFSGAGTAGTTTFDNQKMQFKSLYSCTDCFKDSGFGYRNSYFQFYGATGSVDSNTKTVSSLKDFFRGNPWLADEAPVVILSKSTSSVDATVEKLGTVATGTEFPSVTAFCGGGNGYSIYSGAAGIFDFSGLYADTSIKSADIRGISYCIPPNAKGYDDNNKTGVVDYSSMFENCTELSELKGSLPILGKSYERFCDNCGKLSVDFSKALICPDANGVFRYAYRTDENGFHMESYAPTGISRMFNGIGRFYSTRDEFDLGMFVERTRDCAEKNTVADSRAVFDRAFPVSVISMDGPVRGVEAVSFRNTGISSRFGVMRYCSDAVGNSLTSMKKAIGLGTKIMTLLFPDGFVRFAGYLQTSRYMIFIPYYPVRNKSGQTVELRPWTSRSEGRLRPEGANPDRNVSACFKGHGSWSSARYNPYLVFTAKTRNCGNHRAVFRTVPASTLYGALVYTLDGRYVGRRYVGTYRETIDISAHHYKGCHGTWSSHYSTDHPVTLYSGSVTKPIPPVGSAVEADGGVDSRNAVPDSWYAAALGV